MSSAQMLQVNCPAPLCNLVQESGQFAKLQILEVLGVKRASALPPDLLAVSFHLSHLPRPFISEPVKFQPSGFIITWKNPCAGLALRTARAPLQIITMAGMSCHIPSTSQLGLACPPCCHGYERCSEANAAPEMRLP